MESLGSSEGLERPSRRSILRQLAAAAERGRATQEQKIERYCEAASRLLGRNDLTINALYDVQKMVKSEQFKEENFIALIRQLPAGDRGRWYCLLKFLMHDIHHCSFFAYQQFALHVGHADRKGENPENTPFPALWQEFMQQALGEMPDYVQQTLHPFTFTKALAEMDMGRTPSEVEDVDPVSMTAAITRALQLRFGAMDFALTTPAERQQDRNEIVVDMQPGTIRANPGMLWSVLYNIPKNGCRELQSSSKLNHLAHRVLKPDYRPALPQRLWIQSRLVLDGDMTMINIADSGSGLRVDEILRAMQGIIQSNLLKETHLKRSVARVLEQWKANPFAIRSLSIGDAFDMAAAARVSGFATRERIGNGPEPSGMGLWGSVYLTQKLGGQILFSNLADGGALFTILLPNDSFHAHGEPQAVIRSRVRSFRDQLLAGISGVVFPQISA